MLTVLDPLIAKTLSKNPFDVARQVFVAFVKRTRPETLRVIFYFEVPATPYEN
jgi:hypothetical protein